MHTSDLSASRGPGAWFADPTARLFGRAVPPLALIAAAGSGLALGLGVDWRYLLLAILAAGSGGLALREPQLVVAAVMAFGVGNIADAEGAPAYASTLYKLLVAVLGAICALRLIQARGRTPALPRTLALLLVLLAVFILSTLVAGDADRAIEQVADFARDVLLVFLVATAIRNRLGLRLVAWATIATGALLASLALYQTATENFSQQFFGLARISTQHIVGDVDAPRSTGPYVDPNFFAQYLLVFAWLAFFRAWDERSLAWRLVGFGALLVSLGALVFTFSRGAIVALAISFLVMCLVRRDGWRLLVAGALIAVPLTLLMPPEATRRLSTVAVLVQDAEQGAQTEISFRGRLSETLAGAAMAVDHPLLGVGPANSPRLYQEYAAGFGLEHRRTERAVHSVYLEVAAETGLIGLTAFVSVLISAVADLRKASRSFRDSGDRTSASLADSLLVALVAFLAAGSFLPLAQPRGLWLLVAAAVAARQVAEVSGRQRDRAVPG